jgi:uncharacterized Zn finger protein
MVELARPTRPMILRQVGEASVHKARFYLRRRSWRDLRVQGETVKGRCRGASHSPYRVTATFDGDTIAAAECSCPVGDGGHCKHVAALLLYYRARPEAFVEVEHLDAALERRSKGELIALVRRMIRRVPELELLLEAPLPGYADPATAEDPESYRRQARAAFERSGSPVEVARELADLVATGDEFRESGSHAAAVAVYRSVTEEVLDRLERVNDAGELLTVVSSCAAGLCDCLESAADAPHRDAVLRTLVELHVADEAHGGLGLADSAPEALLHRTSPAERRQVAALLRERLPLGVSWSEEYQRRSIGSLLQELDEGDAEDDPLDRLRRCREAAETEICQRTRDAYRTACNHLKEARDLSSRLDENGTWTDYVAALRTRHRSLRAFIEEMDLAGL